MLWPLYDASKYRMVGMGVVFFFGETKFTWNMFLFTRIDQLQTLILYSDLIPPSYRGT